MWQCLHRGLLNSGVKRRCKKRGRQVVEVNGLTDPPWMDIKEIMLANGGKFANYYSRSTVTHVVCQRLTNAKLDALARSDRDHPPVVTPAWVTGSLAAGRLLPCAEFALEGTLEPGVRRMTSLLPRAEKEKEKPPSTDPATETDGDETEEDADDDVLPTQDDVDVDDDGAPAEPDPRTPRESKSSTDAGFEPMTFDAVTGRPRNISWVDTFTLQVATV